MVLDFSQRTVKLFWFYFLLQYKVTQYNTLRVKLFNSQLNRLILGIKNGAEVTLNLSSNVIGNSNDDYIFPYKLLLTNTHVSRLPKAFANVSSANIKLTKTELHKIGQSGWFLDRILGPLVKIGLPLIKHVLKLLLAKSVLIPFGWTAALSAKDATIRKKTFGSAWTTLIISNEETNDIMKILQPLEESGLLIKVVSEKNKNEVKNIK